MYSIEKNYSQEEIIKKSKFITYLYKISNIEDINIIIDKIKLKHKGATHICYAYRLNDIEKCTDDGEPSGTAGLPILNVLKKENINYIICIVVRYYGGIKLGAGGLIRAYGGCCKNALKNTNIIPIEFGYKIYIEFNYSNQKKVDYILKDIEITNKSYNLNITYTIKITKADFKKKHNLLKNLCTNIKIIKTVIL